MMDIKSEDILAVVKGCNDYNGGYHDRKEWEIYHHGIETVINVVTAFIEKGLDCTQVNALHKIGSNK